MFSPGSSMGLTSQSSPYSSTFQVTQPTFVNNVVASSTPFGASSRPALGADFGFTTSSSPSFSFGSTPAFGQSISAFGSPLLDAQATTPTFGSRGFGFGQPGFGGQRRVPAYTPTSKIGGSSGSDPAGKLESLSAMPFYKGFTVFGQTQPAFRSDLFGSSTPFGASSQPAFGATTNPAFGSSSAPGFSVSSSPSFGFGSAPAFGVSTSAFDWSSCKIASFPFRVESTTFGRQRWGSRVAAYAPTTEIVDGDRGSKKKKIEKLRMTIEVEREVERRVSQRHIDFMTSILEKLDCLNI